MKNNDILGSIVALSASLTLHLLVLYLVVFGIYHSSPISEEQVISFEMLPVSDISNVPTKNKRYDDSTNIDDARKVIESKKPETPIIDQPIAEQKNPTKPASQPEPVKEYPKIAEPSADAVNIKKTETPPKKEKKVTKEQEKSIKKDVKPVNKPDSVKKNIIKDSELDSLLKTLEQSSDGNNNKSSNYTKKSQIGETDENSKGQYDETKKLSISEKSLIQQQIYKFFRLPSGAPNLEQIVITIYISIALDGNVQQVKPIRRFCGSAAANLCQITEENAVRAIWQASPFENLSKERYEIWKEFNFNFIPPA